MFLDTLTFSCLSWKTWDLMLMPPNAGGQLLVPPFFHQRSSSSLIIEAFLSSSSTAVIIVFTRPHYVHAPQINFWRNFLRFETSSPQRFRGLPPSFPFPHLLLQMLLEFSTKCLGIWFFGLFFREAFQLSSHRHVTISSMEFLDFSLFSYALKPPGCHRMSRHPEGPFPTAEVAFAQWLNVC